LTTYSQRSCVQKLEFPGPNKGQGESATWLKGVGITKSHKSTVLRWKEKGGRKVHYPRRIAYGTCINEGDLKFSGPVLMSLFMF
jgi:hypothetical protein